MGIFDFFNKRNNNSNNEPLNNINEEKTVNRELFVKENKGSNDFLKNEELTSWERIFQKLRKDYESEGYNDALSTPDNKYKSDNEEILRLDLSIDIKEAEVEINEYLKELEFHINSRKKADLNDLVEELESKKEVYNKRLLELNEIKTDLKENAGNSKRIILAYNRGFNKGLAALSTANILNKKI
jgi:hypothetical protein